MKSINTGILFLIALIIGLGIASILDMLETSAFDTTFPGWISIPMVILGIMGILVLIMEGKFKDKIDQKIFDDINGTIAMGFILGILIKIPIFWLWNEVTIESWKREKEMTPLIEVITESIWSSRRVNAAEALGGMRDKRAVESLIVALKDKHSDVREQASKALGVIGKPAVEPLIVALKDKEYDVRWNAVRALEMIGKPAVKILIVALKGEDSDVRANAAEALSRIGDRSAVNPLIENLTDWHSNQEASIALFEMGWEPQSDKDRIHLLVAGRKGQELRWDWNLVKSILLKDVESNNYRTIETALYAFMGIGKEEITPQLIETLNTKGNKTMAEAFLNCGHPELKRAAKEWAARYGYIISPGAGTHPVTWGAW